MLKHFNVVETGRTTEVLAALGCMTPVKVHPQNPGIQEQYHQAVSFDEEDEKPGKKRRRKDNAEKVSSLLVFDLNGSTGQSQAQEAQDQAPVLLHEQCTEGKSKYPCFATIIIIVIII